MPDLRVTKRVVDRLIPRATEFTVWDSKLPGFGVRVRYANGNDDFGAS
jgi:hypothetical protein